MVANALEIMAAIESRPALPISVALGGPQGGGFGYGGSKFFGGFPGSGGLGRGLGHGLGHDDLLTQDYWTQRRLSRQLFTENLYAAGLVRRIVTAVVHTGLRVEAEPVTDVIGTERDGAAEVVEEVEQRFQLWADAKGVCDVREQRTFAGYQLEAEIMAMIEGDVLVIAEHDTRTNLPRFELVSGSRVRTPIGATPRAGNRVIQGVEIDSRGRHVAFYVHSGIDEWKRVPTRGPKSGRRLAWLHYYTDRLVDQVRGQPLLGLVLQSIKEMDRFRDSELRAAVVNSILAMFIQKDEDRVSSRPITQARVAGAQFGSTGDPDREYNMDGLVPGMVFETLNKGETPISFDTKRPNTNFADFEKAVLAAIAWANEIPPEVLILSFDSNYSASKAALIQFGKFVTKRQGVVAGALCQPFYEAWFTAKVLTNQIEAPGYAEALAQLPASFETVAAWTQATWSGTLVESIEFAKDVGAYLKLLSAKLIPAETVVRKLTGGSYRRNVRRQVQEMALREAEGLPEPVAAAAPGQPAPGESGAGAAPGAPAATPTPPPPAARVLELA